jgi:hypothetical protein
LSSKSFVVRLTWFTVANHWERSQKSWANRTPAGPGGSRPNPGDAKAPVIRERLAATPQAKWFTATNTGTARGEVDAFVGAAAAADKIPIMVVYDIPNRDCGPPRNHLTEQRERLTTASVALTLEVVAMTRMLLPHRRNVNAHITP